MMPLINPRVTQLKVGKLYKIYHPHHQQNGEEFVLAMVLTVDSKECLAQLIGLSGTILNRSFSWKDVYPGDHHFHVKWVEVTPATMKPPRKNHAKE